MSGCVAQLAEHWIPNPKVVGSNPAAFMCAVKVCSTIQYVVCAVVEVMQGRVMIRLM